MDATLARIDKTFEEYLVGKAPALSKSTKETLVKIAPWLALIFGILAIPALLAAFGLTLIATPFMVLGGQHTLFYWLWFILFAAQTVLELAAVKPLMSRSMTGWTYMFYSGLLGLLANLSNLSIGGLVGMLISFYLLYQVKSQYK